MCVVMLLSLGACGQNANDNTEEHSHDSNTEEEYLKDAEVELKLALSANVGDAHYKAAEMFADEVKEKTDGVVRIEICDARQLGEDKTLLAGIQKGEDTIDILITSVSNYTEIEPRMDITTLPFLFSDYSAAWKFVEGDIQAEIESSLLQKNIHVLAHYSNGFDVVTTSSKAISVASDMQDLSVVVMEGADNETAMRVVGARPMPVEYSQLFQMLQQNQFDGYAGSLKSIYENRIYQMQNKLIVTNHRYDSVAVAIAENVWMSLSEEHQEIIKNAAMNSAYMNRELVRQQQDDMINQMASEGVTVFYPNTMSFKQKAEYYIRSCSSIYGNLVERALIEQIGNGN